MTQPKISLLIPVTGFGRSGGYRVLACLADAIQDLGRLDVTFLAPTTSPAPYYPTRCKVLYADETGLTGGNPDQPKRRPGQALLSLNRAMVRLRASVEVVLMSESALGLPLLQAGLLARTVYYVQAYEPDFYKGNLSPKRLLQRAASYLSYRLTSRHVVNSPLYKNYGPIKATEVVFPGIDLDLFQPKDPATYWYRTGRPITIGTIGRAEAFKGTPAALAGIKAFAATGQSVRVRVALGNVPAEFADLPGLEVVPIGSDPELAEYYRSLDVLVVAGGIQFGAVHYPTLEGLASGLALVSTPYCPAREGNAWMLESPTPERICRRLNEIAALGAGTAPTIAQALADVQAFAWPAIGARMETILMQFAADGAAHGER